MRSADEILTPDRAFEREMEDLYNVSVRPHLMRWYSLEPNHSGRFVRTDRLGFRNESPPATDQAMAFFGGSTMFSTTTDQGQTIPAFFDLLTGPGAHALNFGVGGYSTSAEIGAFIEAKRAYPQIRTALFYDGSTRSRARSSACCTPTTRPPWRCPATR